MTSAEVQTRLPGCELDFETIEVCGIQTERVKIGSGEPLLYLHDGGGVEFAAEFVLMLSETFEVHAVSHPGFGDTALPEDFSSVDDLAYFYLDYLDRENLSDVIVVGAQIGGWIAAEAATKSTTRMRAVVLIDANGLKTGSRDQLDVADIFYLLPERISELGWYEPRPRTLGLTREVARRIARNRESHALFGWSPLLHNPKLMGRLHRIDVPTLVLWGESDRLVPVEHGGAYADAIPDAELRIVPEAGHLPHVEQSSRTVAEIERFLRRQGTTKA